MNLSSKSSTSKSNSVEVCFYIIVPHQAKQAYQVSTISDNEKHKASSIREN